MVYLSALVITVWVEVWLEYFESNDFFQNGEATYLDLKLNQSRWL